MVDPHDPMDGSDPPQTFAEAMFALHVEWWVLMQTIRAEFPRCAALVDYLRGLGADEG